MTDLFRLGRPNRFAPTTQLPQDRTAGFDIIESTGYIADGVVDTDQVAADAITVTEIADDSISTPKLQANAITVGKLTKELVGAQLFYTDFSDISNWTSVGGSGTLTSVASSGGQAGGYIGRIGDNSGNDQYWAHRTDINIPFDPNALYRYHIRARITAGTGVMYAGVVGVAYDGTTLVNVNGSDLSSSQHYIAANNQSLTSSWQDFTGYFKGTSATGIAVAKPDASAPGTLHTSVRYFRPMFLVNYSAAAGTTEIDVIDITRIDITHVANSAGNVVINSSGVTITDGALTIQDEFGTSVMTGGGFEGGWEDQALTGIRNGSFRNNTALTNVTGRTYACPYWTLATVTGSPVFNSQVGRLDFALATTASESGKATSDPIRTNQATYYRVRLVEENDNTSYTCSRVVTVRQYTSLDALISTTVVATTTLTASSGGGPTPYLSDVFQTAYAAGSASDYITIEVKATRGSGDTTYKLYEVGLVEEDQGSGTSFPQNPSTDQRFYRTDLNLEFFYTGSAWHCTCLHAIELRGDDILPISATDKARANLHLFGGGSDIYVETMYTAFYVGAGTALSGSHSWIGSTLYLPSTETITINSGSNSVWRSDEQTVNQYLGTTNKHVEIEWVKTGTPGQLYVLTSMTYRIKAT